MTLPILYSFRCCPYAIRARLAIIVSGLTCELREVSLADKPAVMLRASPKATIPVMILPSGDVLDQSLDIMDYVLGRHDPEGWLVGVNAASMELVTLIDDAFKNHLDHYKYPDRYNSDRCAHRQAGLNILTLLDARLGAHANLTGASYSLIDSAILPFVRQFAAVDEVWFGAQPIDHVQKWLATFLTSPLFQRAMVTLPQWRAGDEPVLFPCPQ